MNNHAVNVEIWGSYPPPAGGVSIHIKRLLSALKGYPHICVKLKDFSGRRPVIASSNMSVVRNRYLEFVRLLFCPEKLIHIHAQNTLAWICLFFFGWRHKFILTLHNQDLRNSKPRILEFFIGLFLKGVESIILNDSGYKNFLLKKYGLEETNLKISSAFISPSKDEFLGVPQPILEFRQKKKVLLSATAWKLRKDKSIDVYGIDLLIKLVKKLRNQGVDAGLILCIPIIEDRAYYESLVNKIRALGIEESIMILNEYIPNAFEIWGISDVFIRPTSTDMEGLSIKESLWMGTPVVASDVCVRPREVFIFKNRELKDLHRATMEALNCHKISRFEEDETIRNIITCYEKIGGGL